jgi:hypothetical protein
MSTRVTTLGELAASIAHEINQPLAAIVADANACLHWLDTVPPPLDLVREALAAVVNDGNRAAEVLVRIRAMLARSAIARQPCELAAVIGDVLPLVRAELDRHGIALQTSLATDLPPVLGDRIQLQQVLLNLLVNAAEAMRDVPPERRRLVVRAALETIEDGPSAVVTVEDAGVGFREPDALHLFDPFFTTKPHGLGMGLSISRSIIEGMEAVSGRRPTPSTARPFTSRCLECTDRDVDVAHRPPISIGQYASARHLPSVRGNTARLRVRLAGRAFERRLKSVTSQTGPRGRIAADANKLTVGRSIERHDMRVDRLGSRS